MRNTFLAVAAGVVLAGCGSSGTATGSAGAASTASTATAAPSASSQAFNDNDVRFAQDMIAHHQQAITMADVALDPKAGAGAEVVALAGQIKAAQGPEVARMTGWLGQWGEPATTTPMSGHDMGSMAMGSVPGMMSADAMNSLMGLKGKAFDRAWLQMMIEHHQGAITMSEAVTKNGSNKDVAALAGQIITAQQAEVTRMTTMLNS